MKVIDHEPQTWFLLDAPIFQTSTSPYKLRRVPDAIYNEASAAIEEWQAATRG